MTATENQSASPVRMPRELMGTCCVPWDADFALDEKLFRQTIRHTLAHGTRHLYVFGTAGEGHAVSDRQFEQVTRVFAEEMRAGDADPMVGVISGSLGHLLERVERAAGLGVRRFQITLPNWGACTRTETLRFFREVCGRYPESSFMHYNVRRAGRLIDLAEYEELAEACPHLVAVKHTGATIAELIELTYRPLPLRFFVTEFAFAAACLLGAPVGFLISLASIHWGQARRYYEAGLARDAAVLSPMAAELHRMAFLLTDAVRGAAHMDNAFDPMFVKATFPDFPLRGLPPYEVAGDAAYGRFVDALRDQLPRWLPERRSSSNDDARK